MWREITYWIFGIFGLVLLNKFMAVGYIYDDEKGEQLSVVLIIRCTCVQWYVRARIMARVTDWVTVRVRVS